MNPFKKCEMCGQSGTLRKRPAITISYGATVATETHRILCTSCGWEYYMRVSDPGDGGCYRETHIFNLGHTPVLERTREVFREPTGFAMPLEWEYSVNAKKVDEAAWRHSFEVIRGLRSYKLCGTYRELVVLAVTRAQRDCN